MLLTAESRRNRLVTGAVALALGLVAAGCGSAETATNEDKAAAAHPMVSVPSKSAITATVPVDAANSGMGTHAFNGGAGGHAPVAPDNGGEGVNSRTPQSGTGSDSGISRTTSRPTTSTPGRGPTSRAPIPSTTLSGPTTSNLTPGSALTETAAQGLNGVGEFTLTSTIGEAQRPLDGPYLTYITTGASPMWFVGIRHMQGDDSNHSTPVLNVRIAKSPGGSSSINSLSITTPYKSDGSGSITYTWDFAAPLHWFDLPIGGQAESRTTRGDYDVTVSRPSQDTFTFDAKGDDAAYFRKLHLGITTRSLAIPFTSLRYDLAGSGSSFSITAHLELKSQ